MYWSTFTYLKLERFFTNTDILIRITL